MSRSKLQPMSLNLNVRGMKPSATVAINELSNQLLREGHEVFKLGLGQSPFPVPESVTESLRAHAAEKDYLQVQGLRSLRESVARHHREQFGSDIEPDDVLIGPGSKELMFILQLTYYGDLVIPSPSWVSYAPQARIIGRHIVHIPTQMENDWFPTPEQLDELCLQDPGRPRLLILNYPSNPTGRTLSPERLKALAEVAREHEVILLSDEIYGMLHHDNAHRSVVPMYQEGTIFSSGLSKWCGAGGWRLGLFVFPPQLRWLLKAMTAVASETFTSTCAPVQYAAIRAFDGGPDIDDYLKISQRSLGILGQMLYERLAGAGLSLLPAQGGFYLFLNFSPFADALHARGIHDSTALCHKLLEETGVAILPGVQFGRPSQELTARLAYVDFDGEALLRDAEKLSSDEMDEAFIAAHCPKVLKAIDRICEWSSQKG